MTELESPEKIAKDILKLERNLNQVADITFKGKEKEEMEKLNISIQNAANAAQEILKNGIDIAMNKFN